MARHLSPEELGLTHRYFGNAALHWGEPLDSMRGVRILHDSRVKGDVGVPKMSLAPPSWSLPVFPSGYGSV